MLDPIFSLRRRVRLEPRPSVAIVFVTAVADSRATALAIADQYRQPSAAERAFELAWAHCQTEHRHHTQSREDVHQFQRLASDIVFAGTALGPRLRSRPTAWGSRALAVSASPETGRSCWRDHGGRPGSPGAQLLAAHSYLRRRGLEFDLVLLIVDEPGHFPDLSGQVRELVKAAGSTRRSDESGGTIVVQEGGLSGGEKDLLLAAARVVFDGEKGGARRSARSVRATAGLSVVVFAA